MPTTTLLFLLALVTYLFALVRVTRAPRPDYLALLFTGLGFGVILIILFRSFK